MIPVVRRGPAHEFRVCRRGHAVALAALPRRRG